MPRPDGLLDDEGVVMDALNAADAAFLDLDDGQSGDELFAPGIFALKNILAARLARREFPNGDGWNYDH